MVENCDIFTPHLCLAAPLVKRIVACTHQSEFREDLDMHKTRMTGLSCGEEIMTIYSAVLIQYQRVTDGRTDVQPISITCFSIADARKTNVPKVFKLGTRTSVVWDTLEVVLFWGAKVKGDGRRVSNFILHTKTLHTGLLEPRFIGIH